MRRTALIAVVLSLAAAGCGRLSNHPLVGTAKEEVVRNRRVIALIGEPIECSPTVTGRANETDGIATIQFEARGPRGRGTVVVEGKKLGDAWGVTLLELRPEGGRDHLHLTADLEDRTGTDTPKFDPSAQPNAPSAPASPPPGDIEIALPPGAPGQ